MLSGWVMGIDRKSRTILKIATRGESTYLESIAQIDILQQMALMKMCDCLQCLFVVTGPDGQLDYTLFDYDEHIFQTEIYTKLADWASLNFPF